MEGQPVHRYMIHDMLRMEKKMVSPSRICAGSRFYSILPRTGDAMDAAAEEAVRRMGSRLLEKGIQLPALREFARLIPGAEFFAGQDFRRLLRGAGGGDLPALAFPARKRAGGAEYVSARMPHLYEGIYAMSFILFPGESLQYFITAEENPGLRKESGILKGG